MSTPCSSAASKLSRVLPGRDVVGALVPDALQRSARHLAPGTSRSCGCRRPGRGRGSACPQRGQAARHGRRPVDRPRRSSSHLVTNRLLHPRGARSRGRSRAPRRRTRRARLRHGSMPRDEAALRLPDVPDARRRCAGRAARRRCRAWGRPRAGGARKALLVELLGARMSGPSAASRWSKRVRLSVISSSTGPSNCTTSCSGVRMHEPGAARRAAPAPAAPVDAPRAAHAQVRVERQVAVEAQEQVLAVRVDRCAPRAPAEPLGPAVHCRGAAAASRSTRSRLAHERRADAGAPRRGSCRPQALERELPRPLAEAELDQQRLDRASRRPARRRSARARAA